MNKAKIRLSKKEQQLVQNADFILTKNQIIQKAKRLLEQLQEDFTEYLKTEDFNLPQAVRSSVPKISRGENYLGLPFLILDYPRCFSKESIPPRDANTFAIRTMFWWGNFFSITLHLSGTFKKSVEQTIIHFHSLLQKEKFFISVNDDEWEHHFEKNNFARIDTLSKISFVKTIKKNNFLKIAYNIPLKKWDETAEKLFHHFKMLIVLTNQLPRR